ncbi:response regulator [Acaryochloris marina]|uniref:response regulator n=1 Tax=Acaryochloris marina TaxID=155978 RepID=UPI0021C3175C|nr:response regulator [Acaryochloris marina]BDM83531.1 hypothetical protein AM10699_63920 [Acaryochloris marina MBIC10699]
MSDCQTLLDFADQLIESNTGAVLSQIQRLVLMEALTLRAKAKTYDQVASETGYSSGYIKAIAAELWKLLSKVSGKKVTKGNVQTMLQQQLKHEPSLLQDGRLVVETGMIPNRQPIIPKATDVTAVVTAAKATEIKETNGNKTDVNQAEVKEKATVIPSVILVVDDQPNIMNLLTSIMEQDEYEVWQASSGAEGLQMAAKVLPDLILLDVNMPDMDGYTVCQQLKADPQTTAIPIIFVSALDESWDKVKGFSVGGSDYITKPFNTLEVIVRIEDQLKIRQIQDQMLKADQAPTDSPQSKPSSAKAVILMVDDEPKNLALLTDVLEQEGYEIWQADSGAEALRVAGMVLPDLILLDINMPDMQGYDVCQQLKANAKTKLIPVIFVSALDETWDKVKAFSVGGSDYITKPFNTLEVIVRIENQLEIRQIQDQMLKADQAPTDSPQPTPSSAKAVILMVDDEPKNLALLTDVLEHDGYEIWQADSGSEALRVAGMVLPDLILLDINMPDMQGYDVCQQLKANAKTKLIPVIFVSALDETWDKVKAFSVGGSDYINKPIQIVELMARMKHQLQIWH